MSKTYDDYREKFEKCTFEKRIGLMRHDIGHELYHVFGYSEILLNESNKLKPEDIESILQSILKCTRTAQDILNAFADPYLKIDQE